MAFYNWLAVWVSNTQDGKSVTLRWRLLETVIYSLSVAVDNRRSNYVNSVTAFLSDWESASWQSRAQKYSCTGLSHFTKIDTSVWILYFASYIYLYEQISSSHCSAFCRDISLSEILGQATYRTWWKHIDTIRPTFAFFRYSSLFLLYWLALTLFQPVSLISVLGESIQEHWGRHSERGAMGFPRM